MLGGTHQSATILGAVNMWTRNELIEMRKRAKLEADVLGVSAAWADACFALASAADWLDALTARIERGEKTSCVTLRPANVE